MRKVYYIILVLTLFSCNANNKNDCYKQYEDYSNSLLYLKEYLKGNDDRTFFLQKVAFNIEFLETQSEIKSDFQGNLVGRTMISDKDILNWENWLREKCKSGEMDNIQN